eukprot:10757203-Lingulodinium_polyedra.AAC.1
MQKQGRPRSAATAPACARGLQRPQNSPCRHQRRRQGTAEGTLHSAGFSDLHCPCCGSAPLRNDLLEGLR